MKRAPLLIVLDANEWISSRFLRSSTGAALIYAVNKLKAKIIIPEVIRDEAIERTVHEAVEATQRITNGYVTVQSLIGKRPDYRLPTREEFRTAIQHRIEELDRILRYIPLTLEQARNAMHRVIRHLPPSDPTEQFRDAILWEVILQAARGRQILFASNDRHFFQDHDIRKGLSQQLEREIQQVGGKISTFDDLASLVASLQKQVEPPNYQILASGIRDAITYDLENYAGLRGLSIGEITSHEVQAFLTEQTDILSLTFHLRFLNIASYDQEGQISEVAEISAHGNCFYDLSSKTASVVSLDTIEAIDPSGRSIPGKSSHYLHPESAISGTRWLPYKLRKPVDT